VIVDPFFLQHPKTLTLSSRLNDPGCAALFDSTLVLLSDSKDTNSSPFARVP
jgi:hypothetical protein